MWGGWYHNEAIMNEMNLLRLIYTNLKDKNTESLPSAETVLFIDEKAYRNIERGNGLLNTVNHLRVKMGNSGIPFDMYMVEDAPKIIHKYKAVIFSAVRPTEAGLAAVELCKKQGIPYISVDKGDCFPSTDDLRETLVSYGVHCYNADACVIYCGNGILAIHTVIDREIKISLPQKYKIKPLTAVNSEAFASDEIIVNTFKHNTLIFELSLTE